MNIRPLVKWHGGKYYLWKWIIEHFPKNYQQMTYVEPYGGMASVLLNKKPSQVEVYNDTDNEIYNLFNVLKYHSTKFQKLLSLTPCHETEFYTEIAEIDQPIKQAVIFYTKCRQSIGGRRKSFSLTIHRSRRKMADTVSSWLSSIDENLPLIVNRLTTVQFLHRNATDVIKKWDSPNTLFYCDPPYLKDTRISTEVYDHEMNTEQHCDMLSILGHIKGHIVLSGYDNTLYDTAADKYGWRQVEKKISNHAAGGKTKRKMVECLWIS